MNCTSPSRVSRPPVLTYLPSPVGTLTVVHDEAFILGLYFPNHHPKPATPIEALFEERSCSLISTLDTQLQKYFAGTQHHFDVPTRCSGTPLQQDVWNELTSIPYGETLSYQELASRVGRKTAVRAVGTAVGRNPLSILIPCHRVIRTDGKLGGYAGGLDVKRQLLMIESNPQ